MAWMGELHSSAARDLIKELQTLRGRKATLQMRCDAAWRIARKYAPRAAALGALTLDIVRDLETHAAKQGCRGSSGLAALVVTSREGSSQPLALKAVVALTEVASGAYADYGPQLELAYDLAQTPDDVAVRTWTVVDQAAADGLPQPDLEVLAGLASISVSSAYDWYAYEQSGGFAGDPGGAGDDDEPMLSTSDLRCGKWCRVGWADLGGALWGAIFSGGNVFVAVYRGTVVSLIAAAVI